jgi:hypothetical protein
MIVSLINMPIKEQRQKLVDDSRTFEPEVLTEVWAWLDSFDSQPLSVREGARLTTGPLTFYQDRYVFRGRIYSVAKCSDGRALLGSIIGVIPNALTTQRQKLVPVQNA